jgi:capsule polysaccharide export protein KpsC/LpsZ
MRVKMVTRWVGFDISFSAKKVFLAGNEMYPAFFLTRERARKQRMFSSIEPVKVRIPKYLADKMTQY